MTEATAMTPISKHLDLPAKVRLSEVSLTFAGEVSYEEWLQACRGVRGVGAAWKWWIGDALAYGEQKYGEKYAQAAEAADHLGHQADTIRKAQWVSERVSVVRRRTSLSWSHHDVVAALDDEEQDRLLGAAEEHELSVADFREEVRRFKTLKAGSEPPPRKPEPPTGVDRDSDPESTEFGPEEEHEDGPDLAGELERASSEIDSLSRLVESLEADDQAAETAKWARKYAQLEGRLRQVTNTLSEAQRTAKYAQGKLREVREALGVERDREILPRLTQILERRGAA